MQLASEAINKWGVHRLTTFGKMPEQFPESDYVFHFDAPGQTIFESSTISEGRSSRLLPPSYEEAIFNGENPSRVVVSPVARFETPVGLEQVFIDSQGDNSEGVPLLNKGDKNSESIESISNKPYIHSQDATGQILPPPPSYTISDASFERTKQGVSSDDEKLNIELEALLRFFEAHNDKPEMAVSIRGWHEESRWESVVERGEDGNLHHGSRSTTVEITDFHLNFDVTQFISSHGHIFTIPQKKNQPTKEIRELMEEYLNHKNSLKEIDMKKVVIWEYEGLSKAITATIRHKGFKEKLTISFPLRNHVVAVYANTKLSQLSRNGWSEFKMNIPPGVWFNQNVQTIVDTVRWL
ncbi:hypothetical protein G9A89_023206 [Geosiphon pyriformis]|nr:hypothetical protein G9A89_023206 [Geosiphon pyriformis]